MQLHTNTVAANSVREVVEDGTTYLVAEDVTLAKPMYLDNGYVPEAEWRKSADSWDGEPGPVGHPTDANGNLISAKLGVVQDNAVISDIRDTYYSDSDDGLNGDIWVNVDKADQLGGLAAEVPEILRNGDPLEVSTAYFSDDGEPGEYDGAHRENVSINLRPDHVALLPGDLGPGRCSRASGCGVPAGDGVDDATTTTEAQQAVDRAIAANGVMFSGASGDGSGLVVSQMAVNAADGESTDATTDIETGNLSAGMCENARSEARTPSYDGTESSSWGDVSKTFENFYGGYPDASDDVSSWSEASQDARQWIAAKSMLGEADADTFDGGLIHPVVNPSTNDLNEGALAAILGSRGETDKASDDAIESSRSKARSLLESKFDHDLDSNANSNSDDMNTNQSEGDRVRWESSNGNWRYGIVADEAESSQQVADDEVLVAVYVNESDGWTRADETVTVEADSLEVIEQFPSEARSANAGGDDGEVAFNPNDLPNAPAGDSASFWSGMVNAIADFARGEQQSNSATADEEISDAVQAGVDDAAGNEHETDHDHSHDDGGCGCGGACDECSDPADEPEPTSTSTSTQTPDSDAEDTDTNADSDDSTTTNMNFNDNDYERLASVSAWSAEELRANDAVAQKVAQTIDEQDVGTGADDDTDDDNSGPGEGPGDLPDNPDDEGDGEDAEAQSDEDEDEDEEMPAWARELQNDVQELKANHEEQKQAQRAEKKQTILANSEAYTESMLDSMGDEDFEEAFERSVPAGNAAPAGTDFGALSSPSAHLNTAPAANADDDEDIGPSTSGSFDDYMAANTSDD